MTPLHPMIAHFPLALTFVLPVLAVVFAFFIKSNKMNPASWLVVIGLQLAVVVSGYVALETGETEEHRVEKVVSKNLIHDHEEAAEIFVGSAVIALVLSIAAFFVRKEIGFPLQLGIAAVGLLSCFLAYRTGKLGGELVYKHGAATAYQDEAPSEALPSSSGATSPVNENESLKPDDNDYGNADEETESPDDDLKQED